MNYELYIKLVDLINEDGSPPDDVLFALYLLTAQDPNSIPMLRANFLIANAAYRMEIPDGLPLIDVLDDGRLRRAFSSPMAHRKVRHIPPPTKKDIPTVRVQPHEYKADCYMLDKHSTKAFMSFHHQDMPPIDFFEKNPQVRASRIDLNYDEVEGRFTIEISPDGSSQLTLHEGFTIEDFIPVKIELIEG